MHIIIKEAGILAGISLKDAVTRYSETGKIKIFAASHGGHLFWVR